MDKYLRQYAERGTAAVADMPDDESWHHVVVIPVCNESTGILRPLPPASGRSLMILVVNETETAPAEVSVANQAFAAGVQARFKQCWQSTAVAGLKLYTDPASPRDVLLVDRFSDGLKFPPKGGVGHARKAGADLAAFLIHQRRVRSPWIHCSDGDVCLPRRYFSCTETLGDSSASGTSALVYPFHHGLSGAGSPGKVMQVTRLYEYSLRYYVAGLSYARSPYAFHTIGSTLAVNATHYAQVRGFPRRQAGEDFYLLNKLAKVGSIRQLRSGTDCEPIEIAARESDRVPFGTGAATARIMKMEDPAAEFLLYQPAVFDLLRHWMESLSTFWETRSSDIFTVLSQKELRPLTSGLEVQGVTEALQHALRQSSDEDQFKRQMHTWFDAFRTLKLIHYLRDNHFPSLSIEALLEQRDLGYLLKHESMLAQLHSAVRKDWMGIR